MSSASNKEALLSEDFFSAASTFSISAKAAVALLALVLESITPNLACCLANLLWANSLLLSANFC